MTQDNQNNDISILLKQGFEDITPETGLKKAVTGVVSDEEQTAKLNAEIEKKKSELVQLEENISKKTLLLNELDEKSERLKSRISSSENLKEISGAYQNEITLYEEKISQLLEQKNELIAAVNSLKIVEEEISSRVRESNKVLAAFESLIKNFNQKTDLLNKRIADKQSSLEYFDKTIDQLSLRKYEKASEMNSVNARYHLEQQKLNSVIEQTRFAESKLRKAEENLKALNRQKADAAAEVERLRKNEDELKLKITYLAEKVQYNENLKMDIARLSLQAEQALDAFLSDFDASITENMMKANDISRKLIEKENLLLKKEIELINRGSKEKMVNDRIFYLEGRQRELSSEVEELEHLTGNLQVKIEAAKNTIFNLKVEETRLKNYNNDISENITELNSAFSQLLTTFLSMSDKPSEISVSKLEEIQNNINALYSKLNAGSSSGQEKISTDEQDAGKRLSELLSLEHALIEKIQYYEKRLSFLMNKSADSDPGGEKASEINKIPDPEVSGFPEQRDELTPLPTDDPEHIKELIKKINNKQS